MTELTSEFVEDLMRDFNALRVENLELKKKLRDVMIPECSVDDAKESFFTGLLCRKILDAIFEFTSPYVPNSRSVLLPFHQFIMVLMKLCLNADNELLSSRFNIHASTVSRYFQKWINVIHERLKPLVKWPEHEQLYLTMPREFKNNFSKCVVIIDCFEAFMQRPKGWMARAQTWSTRSAIGTASLTFSDTQRIHSIDTQNGAVSTVARMT